MSKGNRTDSNEVPALHSILKGQVASIQTYGAFISLEGFEKQGLVHISQISNSKVDDPSEVLEKGEKIWCKIISVSDGKVGLSMKLVNQTTGRDLDPANVQSSLDEQRRKSGHRNERAPIALDAVYDTKCRKCGGSGHLAQDCFYKPGGKTYELLEEEEGDKSIFAGPNQVVVEQLKQMSKKKKKGKKKHKKRKHESSDSSDTDSSEEQHKVKKKKKKRKDSSSELPEKSSTNEKRKTERQGSSSHKHKKEKHKKHRRHSSPD